MGDDYHDSVVLARCFNIEKAEQMFREVCFWTLHWKLSNCF